jgi:hypothetical protein
MRYWNKSGKHMLVASLSQADPNRPLPLDHVNGRVGVESSHSLKALIYRSKML